MKSKSTLPFLKLIPLIGICLFVALYFAATFAYPGGTNLDKTTVGFHTMRNYWCDLTDSIAYDGQPNPAKPIAVAAMTILSLSLMPFWYFLPCLFTMTDRPTHWDSWLAHLIRFSGIGAMVAALFLFTPYHNAVIDWGGLLGGVAILAAFVGLYRLRLYRLWALGVVSLLFHCLSYFIYQTKIGLPALAIMQKITYLITLIWIGLVGWKIYRK